MRFKYGHTYGWSEQIINRHGVDRWWYGSTSFARSCPCYGNQVYDRIEWWSDAVEYKHGVRYVYSGDCLHMPRELRHQPTCLYRFIAFVQDKSPDHRPKAFDIYLALYADQLLAAEKAVERYCIHQLEAANGKATECW